jgi:hypothetical protein
MQILINGISVIENIYDSAAIDSAFSINLAQIEHIEVIRGPSASVYGSNSLFGVINIVTRSGNAIQGVELSFIRASGEFLRQSTIWGKLLPAWMLWLPAVFSRRLLFPCLFRTIGTKPTCFTYNY